MGVGRPARGSRPGMTIRRVSAALVALVAAAGLAGCAGGSRSGSDQPEAQLTTAAASGAPANLVRSFVAALRTYYDSATFVEVPAARAR